MFHIFQPKINGSARPAKNGGYPMYLAPQIIGYGHIHYNETKPPYIDVDKEIPWKYQRENGRIRFKFFGPFTKELIGPSAFFGEGTKYDIAGDFRSVVIGNKVYIFYKALKRSEAGFVDDAIPECRAVCAPIDNNGIVGEFTKVWEVGINPSVKQALYDGRGLRGEKPFIGYYNAKIPISSWILPTGDFWRGIINGLYFAYTKGGVYYTVQGSKQKYFYSREQEERNPYEDYVFQRGTIKIGIQPITEDGEYVDLLSGSASNRDTKLEKTFRRRISYLFGSLPDHICRASRTSIPVETALQVSVFSGRQECRRMGNTITIYNNSHPGAYNAKIDIDNDGHLNFDTLNLEPAGEGERVLRYIKISDKTGGRDRIYKFLACRNVYEIYKRSNRPSEKNKYGSRYNSSIVAMYRYINNDGSFSKWVMSPHEYILEERIEFQDGETEEELRQYLGRQFYEEDGNTYFFPLAVTADRLYLAMGYRSNSIWKYRQISCAINADASLGEMEMCDELLLDNKNGRDRDTTHIHDSFMTKSRIYCVLTSQGEKVEIDGEEKLNINLMWAPLYDEENPGQDEPVTAHGNYILSYPQVLGTGEGKAKSVYTLPYPQINGTGQVKGKNVYTLPYPQIQGIGRIMREDPAYDGYNLPFPYIRGISRIGDYDWILRFKRKEVL